MRTEFFEVYQDRAGFWRWRLRAKNGRIIADSGESYVTRGVCTRAVRRLAGRCAVAAGNIVEAAK